MKPEGVKGLTNRDRIDQNNSTSLERSEVWAATIDV